MFQSFMSDNGRNKESLEDSLTGPTRIFLPQDDGSTKVYSTRIHAPTTLPRVRKDVRDQMREDRISLPQVSTYLRRWAHSKINVQRIVLRYSGNAYSLAVLLDPLSLEGIRDTREHLMHVRDLCGGKSVFVVPLGPEQSNSTLLTSVGGYKIY